MNDKIREHFTYHERMAGLSVDNPFIFAYHLGAALALWEVMYGEI